MALLRELIQPATLERCGDRSFPVLSMTMHDGIMLQSDRFKKSLASVDQSAYKVVRRNQLVVGFPIDEGVLYIQQVADAGIMSPAYDVWNVDEAKVNWQSSELGKVDQGGGGTIAYILGNYNMFVIDAGIPVLNMHAPMEIVSKVDVYEAYLGYKAFLVA